MRSKLFVPGSRPELFAKAAAGDADALSFDMEDAVPRERKQTARAEIARFLASDLARSSGKRLIVRCNSLDSGLFQDDVAAVAAARTAIQINLPKVERAQDVLDAVAVLEAAERAGEGTFSILANIETPRGLLDVAAIASAHPRVTGLQLGLADLFEPYGIRRTDADNVHAAMFAVRIAAAAAGIEAVDAAYPQIDDAEGFRIEAERARALGYAGKSCIHPRQVPLANALFAPNPQEIADARRVLAAAEAAEAAGLAAFRFEGRMVDRPYVARARAILRAAGADAQA